MSESRSPIEMLSDIKSGKISGKALSIPDRRICIEHLLGESYGTSEIAEILKMSRKTIQRDLEEIRASHAVRRDEHTADEFLGGLILHARQADSRLKRVIRDRSESGQVRVDAEVAAWRIQKDLVSILQKSGILPLAAQEVLATVNHKVQIPSREELMANHQEVVDAAKGTIVPEELLDVTKRVGSEIQRLESGDQAATEASPGLGTEEGGTDAP